MPAAGWPCCSGANDPKRGGMSAAEGAGTVGPNRLMRLAARSAEQLLAEARAEAERVTEQARAEADQIVAEARGEAEALLLALEEARARIRGDVALMQHARSSRREQSPEPAPSWLEDAAVEVG